MNNKLLLIPGLLIVFISSAYALDVVNIEQWLNCTDDFQDSTVNNRDGTLQNGAAIVNRRCNFDGNNDYGDTNYYLNQNMNTNYSFSFWVNTTGALVNEDRALAILDQDGGQNYAIQFGYQTTSGSWEYYGGDMDIAGQIAGYRDTSNAQNPFDGTPHHVVINVIYGIPQVYVDGVNDSTTTVTYSGVPTAATINKDYCLAARCLDASQDSQMPVLMWEYAVFNRSLLPAEIALLYGAGTRKTYSDFAAPPGTFLISFVDPTPTSGTVNNTFAGVTINVTSDSNNITIYWNGTLVGNGSATSPYSFVLNSSLVPRSGTYTYNCSNGVNSETRTWIYDTTSPTITLNSNNGFTSSNVTTT